MVTVDMIMKRFQSFEAGLVGNSTASTATQIAANRAGTFVVIPYVLQIKAKRIASSTTIHDGTNKFLHADVSTMYMYM